VAGLFKPLKGRTEYVRALFWGREGSGKTTAALRASRNGRILVIDSEGGLKADALERLGVDPDRVVVLSPPMGGSLDYETLDAAFHQVKTDLAADPESWYAVVIDSLTELVAALVNFAADDRVTKARARGIQIDQVAQFDTDRGDYGTASKMFRDLLRKFEPPGTPGLYETRTGDNHHHAFCIRCGKVQDVDCAIGSAPCLTPSDFHGMALISADVLYQGICTDCQTEEETRLAAAQKQAAESISR